MLFMLGLVSAVLFARFGPQLPIGGGGEVYSLALNLVRDGAFANPFEAVAKTGPSAHSAPLYPFLLAGLMRLFGQSTGTAGWLMEYAVFALGVALLPRFSQALLGSLIPGAVAAVLALCLPLYLLTPAWDAMHTALGLILFCLASDRVLRRKMPVSMQIAGLGLAAALLFLLNPVSIFVVAPWFVLATRRGGATLRSAGLIAGIAFVLGCLPWIVRNYMVFHAMVPGRDDLGIALYASNNDCATPTLVGNMQNQCHDRMHPDASLNEATLVREMGELQYNRSRLAIAVQWIKSHPARFAGLTARRIAAFWFPPRDYAIWLVTILSAPGLLAMLRFQRFAFWFMLAVHGCYPLVYYLVEANARYRYPILWLTLIAAGYAVDVAIRGLGWVAGESGKTPAAIKPRR